MAERSTADTELRELRSAMRALLQAVDTIAATHEEQGPLDTMLEDAREAVHRSDMASGGSAEVPYGTGDLFNATEAEAARRAGEVPAGLTREEIDRVLQETDTGRHTGPPISDPELCALRAKLRALRGQGDPPTDDKEKALAEARARLEALLYALLPLLPVRGSWDGFRPEPTIDPTLRATVEEWSDAAHHFCEAHAWLIGSDPDAAGDQTEPEAESVTQADSPVRSSPHPEARYQNPESHHKRV